MRICCIYYQHYPKIVLILKTLIIADRKAEGQTSIVWILVQLLIAFHWPFRKSYYHLFMMMMTLPKDELTS